MWRSIGQVDGAFFDRCRVDRAELSRFSVDLGSIESRGRAMFPPGRAMSARCAKINLKSILGSILAHPSTTFFEKTGFHVEGARQGTFADAHPPRENLSFQEKCWKGVPKSTINRSWGGLGAPGADLSI